MEKGKKILVVEKIVFILIGVMYAWFGFQKDLFAVFEIPCMGVIGHYILAKENKNMEENLNYAFAALVLLVIGKRARVMIAPFAGCILIGYVLLRYISIEKDIKKIASTSKTSSKLLKRSALMGAMIAILYIVLFELFRLQKSNNTVFFPISEIVTGVSFFATEILYLIMLLRSGKSE